MIDIYFDPNYGKLYEKIEHGKSMVFRYESRFGKIQHMFIKREIPITLDDKVYYDIVTPYGYGGPIITEYVEDSSSLLVKNFIDEFQKYCKENNIVSEFVRFHPVIKNAIDFKEYYNITHIRNTIGTNLMDFEDPFLSEFSKSCRQNIRKALKNGVSYRITEKPSEISKFKEVYYSTMDRNKASDYYYFDDYYFNQCVNYFKDNLLLVEAVYEDKVIAMGFYFIFKDYIHIHLSGTLSDYLYLSPAYILRYGVTQWGKDNGYKLIHHGGGRTNDPEDNLYKFKKQFGKNTEFEFYIGKKVWNTKVYSKLCEMKNIEENVGFFPAYRYEE